jgi:hypothetical protein
MGNSAGCGYTGPIRVRRSLCLDHQGAESER